MNDQTRLEVYRVYTENLRALNQAWKHLNLTINSLLRNGEMTSVEVHTKTLVLLFCAWSEVSFSKLIHTPYGFTNAEVDQIKSELQHESLEAAWEKCLELALKKVESNHERSSYIPNIQQRLTRIVNRYVTEPRIIRNKIAHGQWNTALNRENTAKNQEITNKIQQLDCVEVAIWFDVFRYLSDIVECLIESPNRAFHRDYWIIASELEDHLEKTKSWNMASKISLLRKKPVRRN